MSDQLHVSVADLPSTIAVTSYLAMLDQWGQVWFLLIDDTGSPVLTDTRPEGIDLASRQVFSWLRWQSPDGTSWYIWPSIFGTLFFSRERPMGEGTSMFFATWWSPGRRRWTVALSNDPALVMTGDAVVQLGLVSQPHSIMACRVCPWVGHVDRSNALRDIDGNPLVDRCPRDGTLFYPEDEGEEV